MAVSYTHLTFGVGFGNFFGGSLIKLTGSEVPNIALSATSAFFKTSLPFAEGLGWFGQLFLSYGCLLYTSSRRRGAWRRRWTA